MAVISVSEVVDGVAVVVEVVVPEVDGVIVVSVINVYRVIYEQRRQKKAIWTFRRISLTVPMPDPLARPHV